MTIISFEQQTHRAVNTYFRRLLECLDTADSRRVDRILQQGGLSRELALAGSPEQLLFADFKRVLYTVQGELTADIILRFSKSIHLSDLGILGYTVINSETLGQALEVYARFARLSYINFGFEIQSQKERVILRPAQLLASRLEREDFIASKYHMLVRMLPQDADTKQIEVDLDYFPPTYAESYADFFHSPFYFDRPELGISFPAEWLQTTVSSADHDLYLLCEAQCSEMLSEHGEVAEIVEKVRRILLQPGATGLPLESAADILRMSTRTLREHIYAAGTTYKQIVVDVRMSLAKRYLLESRMSVKEIAYRLNYSQPNAFGRAFKNAFGVSPATIRQQGRVASAAG
jgi:AraC-like DNA-binding protein